MKKNTYYFSHDYNARNDTKILFLRMQLGMEGYGIYWYLIESLAESGGTLPLQLIPVLAMQMHTTEAKVNAVVYSFNLFEITDDQFFSIRLNEHLEKVNQIKLSASQRGKLSAQKRKSTKIELPVEQPVEQSVEKPVEQRKEKERKVKEIKIINTNNFSDDFLNDWNTWLNFKKTNFKFVYKTIESEQIAFNQLYKLSNQNQNIAREIIHQSIANGYKGLFELKQNQNAKPTNQQLQNEYANRWPNGIPELDENYNLIQR
jgi:uncharacterized protein YdaU (DUF1376 family)